VSHAGTYILLYQLRYYHK